MLAPSSSLTGVGKSCILYWLPPDLADKLPPSCGDVSPEISLNSVEILISLELVVSSIATPTPPTIFLNTIASVVGLTARIAPSLPK